MELSEFTLRILLLFFPGIISFVIIDKLTFHKESKIHKILINSFILGFVCYSFYYLLTLIIKKYSFIRLECLFLEALADKNIALNFEEIALVGLLSVPIGFIFAFLINHKILFKVAHALKISKKFGDLDVWSYIMNANEKGTEWVVIRDLGNDLMFEGWIQLFTDSSEESELFLRDVKVYRSSDAEELYEVPGLYLPCKRENLIVEFPLLQFSEYEERPKEKEEK